MSLAYLSRIDGEMIREHGLDAAALHALILWRSKRHGTWVATAADIFDDIALPRRRYEVARETLRDAGLLLWEPCGGRQFRWSVVDLQMSDVTNQMPHVAIAPSIRENPKNNYTDTDVSDEENAMSDAPEPIATVHSIDGALFPDDAVAHREQTPEEMANSCRQEWLARYTDRHGRPHPSIRGKAFGHIGRMVKTSETPEDYRDVWRAAHDAGEAGEWAVENWLGVRPQSRYERRQNLFAVQAQRDASAGLLDDYLGITGTTARPGLNQ